MNLKKSSSQRSLAETCRDETNLEVIAYKRKGIDLQQESKEEKKYCEGKLGSLIILWKSYWEVEENFSANDIKKKMLSCAEQLELWSRSTFGSLRKSINGKHKEINFLMSGAYDDISSMQIKKKIGSSLSSDFDLNAATQFIQNRFDNEMVDSLNSEFTSEEVKAAVFGLVSFKAPGPDGFHALFFQKS
ncbi:hypothetical protein Dsin_002654 [Dipteronia sinensis]|uniref:Uncharacterized protein n=1 Tax=Dipteronia sinensis TaxID=43782 RepID=A0AAE0B686_9ROSI|nr:hypothetical protein Dsin_002654 [Dipteronia sinensis]